jgi:hypothetical protein
VLEQRLLNSLAPLFDILRDRTTPPPQSFRDLMGRRVKKERAA